MSSLAERIAALSPEQRKLFEQKLKQQNKKGGIPRRQTNGAAPLSFAQHRLWFLHQLDPDSPAFNSPAVAHLTGRVDVPCLKQSLNEIVKRHEILRTRYDTVNGEPVQIVLPSLTLSFPLIDLRHLPAQKRESLAHALMHKELLRPFSLADGPLLRPLLLQLDITEYILLLTRHHIVTDAWSDGIFLREMVALYKAFIVGKPPSLPAPPIQYADYAQWQREQLQGEALADKLAYWRKKLAGAPAVLPLPTDKPRPSAQTSRGGRCGHALSADLTHNLKKLGQQENVTLPMLILTAFYILLHYRTQQNDIVIGSAVANRNYKETEQLIGFFVNQLVLRANLEGNPTFRQLLEQVRNVCLDAYDLQDTPFEKLVEHLKPKRTQIITPLFQIVFVSRIVPMPTFELPDLTLKTQDRFDETTQFDLTLYLMEAEVPLRLSMGYRIDLFNDLTIRKMLESLAIILHTAVSQLDTSLDTIKELLDEAHKQQIEKVNHKRRKTNAHKLKKVRRRTVQIKERR